MKPLLPVVLASLALAASALAGPKHGDKWIIGDSQCNLGEPWRVQMNADIRKAAEAHPDLEVVFKDAQNDTLRQRAQIEEFVNADVDLLIVSPKEAAPLTAPVAAAFHKGIPVIVLDRKVRGDEYTIFIGADNKRIGKAAGDWAVKRLLELPIVKQTGRAKIVEIKGLMTSTPAQDRYSGFHEAIQGQPVDIVFSGDAKWLEPEARSEMESALAVNPRIDLVYGHNDPSAHGAYLAARAAGREGDILFIGIDGLPQEGQVYVRQGILAASFEYPTGGHEAVEYALKILHGETVPKQVTLRSRYFTKENIARGGDWIP
ncbi:MAG TPA: substrate-binding domain-containing protein [Opitutaceae bacterium]|jgi:ribose transport system substrate-binding protein